MSSRTKHAVRSSRKYQENERTKAYVFNGYVNYANQIKTQKEQKKTFKDMFHQMLKDIKNPFKKGDK